MPEASLMRCPQPAQLAALGSVLCLYPEHPAGVLAGWQRAVCMRQYCAVDSDGLDEALLFFDQKGQCCWRLQLLPDSDFLAWDALCSKAQYCYSDEGCRPSACERLRRRLCARLLGPRWYGGVLRFCVLHGAANQPSALAVRPVQPSALGAALAERTLHAHGADTAMIAPPVMRHNNWALPVS